MRTAFIHEGPICLFLSSILGCNLKTRVLRSVCVFCVTRFDLPRFVKCFGLQPGKMCEGVTLSNGNVNDV